MNRMSRKKASEQHIDAMAIHITSHLFKTLAIAEVNTGTDHTGDLFFNLLTRVIGAQVWEALSKVPANLLPGEETEQFVLASLRQTRESVERAVASAFSQALSSYGGRDTEYGCSISIMPEAANKEMI